MGIIELDAYVLIISGVDRWSFIDGLSTNKVEQSCSTVLTDKKAKIIDVIDVVEVGENCAVVGYGPYKENVLNHFQPRILQQKVSIRDVTSLNRVYASTSPFPQKDGATVSQSYLGWIVITSQSSPLVSTLSEAEFTDYRTRNLIPYQGYEITPKVNPFNCGLEGLVHQSKGCYIGQEILTRMRSRGQMGKQLMQVSKGAEDAISVGDEFALVIRRTAV